MTQENVVRPDFVRLDAKGDELEPWRLCSHFTVVEAAFLIAGESPAGANAYWKEWEAHKRPHTFEAARRALMHAVLNGEISCAMRHRARLLGLDDFPNSGEVFAKKAVMTPRAPDLEDDFEQSHVLRPADDFIICESPDWEQTTIGYEALRRWLSSRGVRPRFFFPEKQGETPQYLDPRHQRYSAKLAAAVTAWTQVGEDPPKSKTPKQTLTKWLNENAARFGLTDEEGTPNKTGIEEVAKVANWEPGGGAPRTSG